jgi:hypothetical protein
MWYIDRPKSLAVRRNDGTRVRLNAEVNATDKTTSVKSKEFGAGVWRYVADTANPKHLTVDGAFNKGQIHLEWTRRSADNYLLLTRGFHWVSEDPYNY